MTPARKAHSTAKLELSSDSLDPILLECVREELEGTSDSLPTDDIGFSTSDFELQARLSRLLAHKKSTSCSSHTNASDLWPSFPIDRFQIREVLGEGGFGVVFRAYDPQLDKEVALKVLRPEAMLSQQVRDRFLQEAKTAARLEHPGIVATHEVGNYRSVPFIASSLCDGPNLADWLDEQSTPLSPKVVARVIADLADAVHHAHSRGVLHRDIKPTNVLLQPDSQADSDFSFRPLLTDFGLAKRLDCENTETKTGTVLGTAHYMSPEQASGRWREVGIASDVFSLGVILYEMLTGTRPFSGENTEQVKVLVISGEPTAPRKIRSEIPPGLEQITLKCLAKAPAGRYDSARALYEDLQNFLHHQPLTVRPAGFVQRFQLWCRRHPAVAILSLSLGISIIASFIVILRKNQNERVAREEAEKMLAVAREAVKKSYTRMADRWLLNEPNAQDMRLELLADALQFYRDVAGKFPDDEQSRYDLSVALHRVANVLKTVGRTDEAIQLRRECVSIVNQLAREHPEKQVYRYDRFFNLSVLAGELNRKEQNDERLAVFEEARAILQKLRSESPDDETFQDAYAALCIDLAMVYEERAEDLKAIQTFQEAAEISQRLADAHPARPLYIKHAAVSYSALGNRFARQSRFEDAEKYSKRAVTIVADLCEKLPHDMACQELASSVRCNYSNWLYDNSRHAEAAPVLVDYVRALDALIHWNPKTTIYRSQRADAFSKLGRTYSNLGQLHHSRQAYLNSLNDCYHLMNEEPIVANARELYDLVKSSCPFPELRQHPHLP